MCYSIIKTTFGFTNQWWVWYIQAENGQKRVPSYSAEKMGYIDFETGISVVHDSRVTLFGFQLRQRTVRYDTTKDELNHFTAGMGGLQPHFRITGLILPRSGEVWKFRILGHITHIVINEALTVISPKTSRCSISIQYDPHGFAARRWDYLDGYP